MAALPQKLLMIGVKEAKCGVVKAWLGRHYGVTNSVVKSRFAAGMRIGAAWVTLPRGRNGPTSLRTMPDYATSNRPDQELPPMPPGWNPPARTPGK
jgi:hypothetical protein